MTGTADLLKILKLIRNYLDENGIDYYDQALRLLDERRLGRKFLIGDYIRALIYAQLSNQTRWSNISPKLVDIDTLFFNYDANSILKKRGSYFHSRLLKLKCGNISTRRQMESLNGNIKILRRMESDHGSIDQCCQHFSPEMLVREISRGVYKMKYLGPALAWEFLRNVGLDGVKPDLHLRRIFGESRLGLSAKDTATESEVIDVVTQMSLACGWPKSLIDNLLWNYCAHETAGCCGARPKCDLCVIKKYCNHPRETPRP